jgi:AmiR/NasT family two-component response regulator
VLEAKGSSHVDALRSDVTEQATGLATCRAQPVIDQAAAILMDLLHCEQHEAVALLQAQSLAADVEIDLVAQALVGAST